MSTRKWLTYLLSICGFCILGIVFGSFVATIVLANVYPWQAVYSATYSTASLATMYTGAITGIILGAAIGALYADWKLKRA